MRGSSVITAPAVDCGIFVFRIGRLLYQLRRRRITREECLEKGVNEVGKSVGSTVGLVVGATIGGLAGAAIGSIAPVIGTATVGAIGSAIGGVFGSAVGKFCGKRVVKWVLKKYRRPTPA